MVNYSSIYSSGCAYKVKIVWHSLVLVFGSFQSEALGKLTVAGVLSATGLWQCNLASLGHRIRCHSFHSAFWFCLTGNELHQNESEQN